MNRNINSQEVVRKLRFPSINSDSKSGQNLKAMVGQSKFIRNLKKAHSIVYNQKQRKVSGLMKQCISKSFRIQLDHLRVPTGEIIGKIIQQDLNKKEKIYTEPIPLNKPKKQIRSNAIQISQLLQKISITPQGQQQRYKQFRKSKLYPHPISQHRKFIRNRRKFNNQSMECQREQNARGTRVAGWKNDSINEWWSNRIMTDSGIEICN